MRSRRPTVRPVQTIHEGSPLEADTASTAQQQQQQQQTRTQRSDTASANKSPLHKQQETQASKTSKASRQASSKAPRRRRISWYSRVEKKRHHRVQDLSQQETEAMWLTENDSKLILATARVTVKMMMQGEHCDDVDYCSRGLEGKTADGARRRQKNKLRVRKRLLEEQNVMRQEGSHVDYDYLGELCVKYSRECVLEAHYRGLDDEDAIQDYLSMHHSDMLPIQPRRIRRF